VPVAPLAIAKEEHAPTCILSTWEVTNTASFVDVLAWLYLRKPSRAARIINQLEPGPAGLPGRIFQNAIDLLRCDVTDIEAALASADPKISEAARRTLDAHISLRDGLLFQHISWVAATIQFPGATACPPHVRKADKGFDGLLIEVDPQATKLSRLVLCEDKASTNPRALVTSKIWPEIKLIVAGERDLEILDAVTALLDMMHDVDREAVLIGTTWDRIRQYRIALAAGDNQLKPQGYDHLFLGYDEHIAGALQNRMAEVMPMADVRSCLGNLAAQVIARIEEMAAVHV
jgi:hypothetical protein